MKDKLIFDTTSMADSDNVGAHLRAEDGSLVSHTKAIKKGVRSYSFSDLSIDVSPSVMTIYLISHDLETGQAVQLTTDNALPPNVNTSTVYYVIRVDASTVKLAASKQDAYDGVFIDLGANAGAIPSNNTIYEVDMEKVALDVSIVNGLNVEVDLSAADDSVAAWLRDGFGNQISSTNGQLNVTLKSDLGDSLYIDPVSGGIFTRILDGAGNSLSSTGGALHVSATDFDIRDLQFATDQVQIGNASGVADFDAGATTAQTLRVTLASDTSVTTTDAALANSGIAVAALTVSTGTILLGTQALGEPLPGRKYLYVYNEHNKKLYIGPDGSTTTANGFPLSPGSYLHLRVGDAIGVAGISDDAAHPVRSLELA